MNCAFLRSMLALGLSLGFGFNFFCCIGKEVGNVGIVFWVLMVSVVVVLV